MRMSYPYLIVGCRWENGWLTKVLFSLVLFCVSGLFCRGCEIGRIWRHVCFTKEGEVVDGANFRKGLFMKNRGFSLVELMVVVAIIAILTAIALPLYSTFRRRAVVQGAIAPCSDARKAIMAHFQDQQTFTGFGFLSGNAGPVVGFSREIGAPIPMGSSLPPVRGLTWVLSNEEISAGTVSRAIIEFQFTDAVCTGCDGRFCILCDTSAGSCVYEVNVDITNTASNPLNSLDKNRNTACTLGTVAAAAAAMQGP